MKPLMIFFLPWAYFFTAGRPLAGVIHLVLWLISIPLFFMFGLGFIIWGIQVMIAFWDLRKQVMEEQATAIANKMAVVMQQQNQPEPPQAS